MNVFCSISFKVWGRLTFSVLQLRNLHLADKAWQGNIKSAITEYSQYFHGGEGISSSQRSIQEAKSSPHVYPVLNYYCKEPFFMLNHWKAYDEIISATSWACQVICSFRRYEICRQPWFEGSPGETSAYYRHNYVWQNWALIHQVMTSDPRSLPGDHFQAHSAPLCTAKPWESPGTSKLTVAKCVYLEKDKLGRTEEELSTLKFTSALLPESSRVRWPVGHVTRSLHSLPVSPTELDKMKLSCVSGVEILLCCQCSVDKALV